MPLRARLHGFLSHSVSMIKPHLNFHVIPTTLLAPQLTKLTDSSISLKTMIPLPDIGLLSISPALPLVQEVVDRLDGEGWIRTYRTR